jgi:KaiC/GvpD/RAD55 family RecA-like ATPase/uncharacterized protein YeeX (DUF496 family)
MGSGSGVDLFGKFNEVEVGKAKEALSRCTNCGRFVLIGPPRSGKTFFREKYLEGRLGAGVTIDEHTLGITTTTKTEGEEAKGELGIREKVMRILEGMIPLIRRLREKVRVEDEELRRVLGDRAPRHVVEGARGMIGDSPHRAYYIPWDSDEVRKCMEEPSACAFGADVGKALKLIKEAFGDNKRIKWFRAEYIPPGLVEEVVDLIKEKGEDGAREVLRGWVEAYSKAIEALSKILGVREELFEWESLSVVFLNNFVNNYAKYVIGSLATALMGAASLALISVLTYMAFKKEGENYLKEIIELRESLEGLRRRDGEFSELGGLLVYRVAYAMGMSYEEAKEALMDIADLSIDELERRVNEIERRIEELEVKVNELNNRVNLLKQELTASITIASKTDFEQGIIYPNIKVENGELRIRVGDGYHSIVRAGKFNELANEVRGRLTSNGVVVVVGPKGIGKSTLAAAVIWKLFMNGDIGLVARVDMLDKENYSEFARFVENYGKEFSKYFGKLLILYDPVSTKAYEKMDVDVEAPVQTNIERTVKNLMDAIKSISSEALRPLMLIVLPSDIYNALSNDMRAKLESHSLDVSQVLINTEFLAELIREYTRTRDKSNGCELSSDVFSKLAGELAEFDSGHALIARLIGEGLSRNNCDVGKIEKLINNAKGKAEAFIILHINGLFKVHENPNTAKALVEIFTLRGPFIDEVRPGDPILTPGIVGLIGEERGARVLYGAVGKELRSWLAIRQHDLIEEAIKKLLICIVNRSKECEELGDALEPWSLGTVRKSLREVSEKVLDEDDAVKYFIHNYGKEFTNTLRDFSNECWKRAALIIGYASAGRVLVPRPEDLPNDVAESLGDALNRCGVDDYLLVGDVIPQLIWYLIKNHARASTEAFIDKYNEAVAEVRRVRDTARGRGSIYDAEGFYGLGLASIIASTAKSGKVVKPGDADATLHMASFAIQHVASANLIIPILRTLRPLRGKAPLGYLKLLAFASNRRPSTFFTLMYILIELSEVLDNYGYEVEGHAWSFVHAIIASANLLMYLGYSSDEEIKNKIEDIVGGLSDEETEITKNFIIEDMVGGVAELLNELDKLSPSLGVVAWAYALGPALIHRDVRRLMEEKLGINVVDRASEILGGLGRLRGLVQELMGDKEFMSYIESVSIKADEEAVRKTILETSSHLKHALARYRLRNDELDKAEKLSNEAAEEYREIGDYENYLAARGLALRVEAIKGSLLVDEFRRLYEEAFNKERFKPTVRYLSIASYRLDNYLVSLALTGDDKKINELLEEHWQVLDTNEQALFLIWLTLNALLRPRGGLSSELSVIPVSWINAFEHHMHSEFLYALPVALDITRPEEGFTMCMLINDSTKGRICMDAISVAMNDDAAVVQLREQLINRFRRLLSKRLGLLKELGADADALFNEFRGLVNGL